MEIQPLISMVRLTGPHLTIITFQIDRHVLLAAIIVSTSHLREMPCLLFNVGHLVTVEELWKAADLIVHNAASVLAGAPQRTQEQLTLFGVTSQLWENSKTEQSEGS